MRRGWCWSGGRGGQKLTLRQPRPAFTSLLPSLWHQLSLPHLHKRCRGRGWQRSAPTPLFCPLKSPRPPAEGARSASPTDGRPRGSAERRRRKGWRNRPVRPPGAAPGLGERCGESGRPGLLAASGAVRGQEARWPLPRLYSVERRQSILQGGGITSFSFVSFLNLSLSQFIFFLIFFFSKTRCISFGNLTVCDLNQYKIQILLCHLLDFTTNYM